MNEDWIKFLKESSSVCTIINTEVQIFIQKESWKKNSVEIKLWRKALLLKHFLQAKQGKTGRLILGVTERVTPRKQEMLVSQVKWATALFSTKTQAVRLNSHMVLKPTYFNSIHFAKPALPWQIQKAVNAEIRAQTFSQMKRTEIIWLSLHLHLTVLGQITFLINKLASLMCKC